MVQPLWRTVWQVFKSLIIEPPRDPETLCLDAHAQKKGSSAPPAFSQLPSRRLHEVAADSRLRARAGLPCPCIDSRLGHVGWNPSPPVPWADVPEGPGSAGGTTTSVCSAGAHPADSAPGNVMWCEDGHQGCVTGYKHPTASATWGWGWGTGGYRAGKPRLIKQPASAQHCCVPALCLLQHQESSETQSRPVNRKQDCPVGKPRLGEGKGLV